MTHVEEVCTEHTNVLCQLVGSTGLEGWTDTNSAWNSWPASV